MWFLRRKKKCTVLTYFVTSQKYNMIVESATKCVAMMDMNWRARININEKSTESELKDSFK